MCAHKSVTVKPIEQQLGMVVHTYNPSAWEAEAGVPQYEILGQRETLPQSKQPSDPALARCGRTVTTRAVVLV